MVTAVPGDSAPGKLLTDGFVPPVLSVKLEATAPPPLSLTTCLITVSVPLSIAWTVIEQSVSCSDASVAANVTTNVPGPAGVQLNVLETGIPATLVVGSGGVIVAPAGSPEAFS